MTSIIFVIVWYYFFRWDWSNFVWWLLSCWRISLWLYRCCYSYYSQWIGSKLIIIFFLIKNRSMLNWWNRSVSRSGPRNIFIQKIFCFQWSKCAIPPAPLRIAKIPPRKNVWIQHWNRYKYFPFFIFYFFN